MSLPWLFRLEATSKGHILKTYRRDAGSNFLAFAPDACGSLAWLGLREDPRRKNKLSTLDIVAKNWTGTHEGLIGDASYRRQGTIYSHQRHISR
jgi:hypothetical protein